MMHEYEIRIYDVWSVKTGNIQQKEGQEGEGEESGAGWLEEEG